MNRIHICADDEALAMHIAQAQRDYLEWQKEFVAVAAEIPAWHREWETPIGPAAKMGNVIEFPRQRKGGAATPVG